MNKQNKQQGFSLVELMISITIGLILMTGVVQMFLTSKTVFSTQQGLSRVQESGRLAIDFMAKDIREAGYLGCISRSAPRLRNLLDTTGAQNKFLYDFDSKEFAIRGYTAEPAGSDLNPNPLANTDILVVRSAGGKGASTSKMNTNTAVFVTHAGGTAACPSGICKDDILIVTDCAKARIFQATAVGAPAGGEVAISHNGGNNTYNTWGGGESGPEESFAVGSEVINLQTTVYYIANNTEGNPGLWQKIGQDSAFELLEGVEDMSLVFGVDLDDDDFIVDATMTTASNANWDKVRSVEVELLIRSTEDNASPEVQKYDFAGATNITAPDKRIRQVFSTSVAIRSRLQ